MATIGTAAGGGLGGSKLALATATAADVAEGKTFYAGDKELKTGTMPPGSVFACFGAGGAVKKAGRWRYPVKSSSAEVQHGAGQTALLPPGRWAAVGSFRDHPVSLGKADSPSVALVKFDREYQDQMYFAQKTFVLTEPTAVCVSSDGGYTEDGALAVIRLGPV